MISCIRHALIYLVLLISLTSFHVDAESTSLLTHTSASGLPALTLTSQQQQWLAQKKTLVVGVAAKDFPPYGLQTANNEYEGLNADYLGLLASQLKLPIRLVRYDNNEQLWRALANGEIDLFPTSTAQPLNERFVYSHAYADEQPLLAVKTSETKVLPTDMAGVRIAMAAGYLPLAQVRNAYPRARIQVFDTNQEALSAVAFGQAQVYLGNSYPIGRNYLNNLRIDRLADLPERNTAFAMRKSDTSIVTLINAGLQAIPKEKQFEAQQLWQAGASNNILQMMKPLALTPEEQQWIQTHSVVKVLLYGTDNMAPVAFIDSAGEIRGITTDLLAWISSKTGLKFSFRSNNNLDEIVRDVNSADADMVAAISPSAERRKSLLFTYPYVRTAFAIVTDSHNQTIRRLSDLRGKKLALIHQASFTDYIAQHYPEIQIVSFDKDRDMYSSVASGKTDALLGLLISANYQVNNRYRGQLKVVTTIGVNPAYLSFAVGKDDTVLQGILNKALIAIPPNELESMVNRWRPNNMIVLDSFWARYRNLFIGLSLLAFAILAFMLVRTIRLRREVRRAAVAQQQLTEQLALQQRLVEGMPFPISLRDRDLKLIYCNPLYAAQMGHPITALQGKTLREMPGRLSAEKAAFFQQKMHDVMLNDVPDNGDYELTLQQGEEAQPVTMTANVWLLPWHDAAGNVMGVVTGLWDISERQKLLQQLSEASQRAEESNRAKSTFLSTMSHEIRTPMNAIIGMLDMAIKQAKDGKQDLQALEVAFQSAEGLVGLIGDILDLSRIEGGHLEFRPTRINLKSLIDQLLVIFNGLALDKNITLSKIWPDDDVVDVIGDPLRIKQVLSNVLSNAIKFTDQGGVRLSLSQRWEQDNTVVCYVIEVKDSGIGIPVAQQSALFQPFAQADNRRAGTGLGLYISRNLCETMGGGLTLSSVLHEGTTAHIELRLPVATQQQKNVVTAEVLAIQTQSPLNILVVDDNGANRILLAKQLAWLGHHAHVSSDAFEAFELWQKHLFDVVITDCNMPGMNGYQLTQRLREAERAEGKTPVWIIGFTANAMQEIIERCKAAGMDGCLFKPCSLNSLALALNERETRSSPASLTLRDMTEQDAEFERELNTRIREALIIDFSALKLAVAEHAWDEVGRLAHRLSGSVRIARQPALVQACQQLELVCQVGGVDEDAYQQRWQKLKAEIEAYLLATKN